MESLKDKVAIITGAGSGFGRCTSLLFAKYGALVVLADMNLEGAEAVAAECVTNGHKKSQVLAVKCDITKDADRVNLVGECVRTFGRIDILINNAGVYRKKSMLEADDNMYDFLMDVNLKAQIFLTKVAVPYLKMTKGTIVNLSSIVAEEAVAPAGVYCISKAGIDCATKVLAIELAEFGVRVNSVRPGTMHTGLYDVDFGENVSNVMKSVISEHPLGRLGLPEEVAKAVAFLACDLSSYSTGNFFFVDGGRHCVGARHNPHLKAQ
ncbi:3-oxoacyl-[acyl-carrier-protein] reductase FabG-like [Ylistrum balloti]|uniref:3-oxoacyl-[acyl-carrier-protein] reductase FabG-like n=1 Tax=Ylistrum balloti TaxID=509963 RepID=UPI002905A1F1|nr:3-oxoacyl-[acyl-carrier-protein] reductase FabG-like [Ylistrum balloti]